MTSFDLLKNNFLPDKNHPRFDVINLTLGALAGYKNSLSLSFFRTIAVTLTYPSDVVRRLL